MSDEISHGDIEPEVLRRALKAFKKTLKLARLDDESSLGRGSKDKSRGAGIVAIRAPEKYPQAVWDKLVELGKLRRVEAGLYQLPD
ncbi:MAG: hypothetical protein JW936_03560 [Sedimentisphaerales bacterium]|nr:hypothetical protein [Sedimentisphaerales bacterium]